MLLNLAKCLATCICHDLPISAFVALLLAGHVLHLLFHSSLSRERDREKCRLASSQAKWAEAEEEMRWGSVQLQSLSNLTLDIVEKAQAVWVPLKSLDSLLMVKWWSQQVTHARVRNQYKCKSTSGFNTNQATLLLSIVMSTPSNLPTYLSK